MSTPIQPHVSSVFLPVQDIEKARAWYGRLLGLTSLPAIVAGHLCCLPTAGAGLVLDSMPNWRSAEGALPTYQTPAFMFQTGDIEAAYHFMQEQGAQMVTTIQDSHWFAFRDPDGNLLMVCNG